MAAGSADDTIQVWNITNPRHPVDLGQPLSGPVGYVDTVAFDPVSDVLAAGSGDDTVWLWDETHPDRPVYLATLTGPAQGVLSIAFSSTGQLLAAGSLDHTVRTWSTDAQSAQQQICAVAGTPMTPREWAQYVPGQPYAPPARDAPPVDRDECCPDLSGPCPMDRQRRLSRASYGLKQKRSA